jgi:hypothetical protein
MTTKNNFFNFHIPSDGKFTGASLRAVSVRANETP